MSRLELIVERLKSLPPGKLELAASYIEKLRDSDQASRRRLLLQTSGSLPQEVADEIEKAIEEACERVDEHDW